MILRRMQVEDADAVAKLESENFSLPWSKTAIVDAMNKEENVYVVATIDDEVIGYAGAWGVFNELEITNVCVDVSHRNMGVGAKIMEFLIKEGQAKGKDTFFLEVRESNGSAIKLYSKMGFDNIGIRKNFYERPVENAIVMSRILL